MALHHTSRRGLALTYTGRTRGAGRSRPCVVRVSDAPSAETYKRRTFHVYVAANAGDEMKAERAQLATVPHVVMLVEGGDEENVYRVLCVVRGVAVCCVTGCWVLCCCVGGCWVLGVVYCCCASSSPLHQGT